MGRERNPRQVVFTLQMRPGALLLPLSRNISDLLKLSRTHSLLCFTGARPCPWQSHLLLSPPLAMLGLLSVTSFPPSHHQSSSYPSFKMPPPPWSYLWAPQPQSMEMGVALITSRELQLPVCREDNCSCSFSNSLSLSLSLLLLSPVPPSLLPGAASWGPSTQ